ncbi:MAG: sigma-70 family RNA polymerase sigma factor [Isosphaeraceae bacterium]
MSCAGRGIVLRQIDRLFREGTLGGLGDGQLLERYLTRRDEAAFEALVDLHGPMVLGLCRRMLRDPRDIEDAFQATFLVLVRKAPAIRDRSLLSSWLYGVAYRVARRARSRTLRRRDRETSVADLVVAAGPETSDRLEVDPVLDQELNRLPEKYRAPLILCYLRGRTHDQAAEELRCPVGTVRSRLARGRDLLRRRLTQRGFAPSAMAAFLSTGPSLPARLLVEAVPPSLVSATLKAAFGFGSAQTIQVGAIATSVVALAQGVLTTMRIAQLQWIGLAILATSLSAGGVVAVSYAASQTRDAEASKSSAAGIVPDPQEQANGRRNGKQTIMMGNLRSERFDALEQKVDELLKRLDANPPTPSSNRPDIESQRRFPSSAKSIQELAAQLKQVVLERDNTKRLVDHNAVSSRELELYHNKVLVAVGQIEGLDEDLADEIARLKLEMRRKNAEREKAEAQKEVAQTVTARNTRLNERKPGMVAAEDVAKAEGETKVAQAQVGIVEAEIAEVGLRIQQLERRRERIKQAMVLANAAKAASPAPTNLDVKKPKRHDVPFMIPNNNLERKGFTGQ